MGFDYKNYDVQVPSMPQYASAKAEYHHNNVALSDMEIQDRANSGTESVDLNDLAANSNKSIEKSKYESDNKKETPFGFKAINDINDTILTGVGVVGATAATGVLSLVEGLAEFGECILDTKTVLETVVVTPFAFVADLVTGDDLTKRLWDTTKAKVSEDVVKTKFDYFYNHNPIGKGIRDNALGFGLVRGLGTGVGHVAGIIVVTYFTAGIGTVGLGASAGVSGAQSMGMVAGIAGFGKGVANSWKKGASTIRGLAAGALTGAWEGLEFYLGRWIAEFAPTTSAIKNIFSRAGADTVLGASEGFIRPFINSVSANTDYSTAFEESGGFYAVALTSLFGAFFSLLGEFGLRKRIVMGDMNSKVDAYIDDNYRKALMEEFSNVYEEGSSPETLDLYRKMFSETGNPEAMKFLNAMIGAKEIEPDASVLSHTAFECECSYQAFDGYGRTILSILDEDIRAERYSTLSHESGHFLHEIKLQSAIPENIEDVFARARVINSTDSLYFRNDYFIYAQESEAAMRYKAHQMLLEEVGFSSVDDYCKAMTEDYINTLNEEIKLGELADFLNSMDIDLDKYGLDIFDMDVDSDEVRLLAERIASKNYKSRYHYLKELLFEKECPDIYRISDIISALYKGHSYDLYDHSIDYCGSHSVQYYARYGAPFEEMIANYTTLRTTGRKNSINILRKLVGPELVDVLEETYQALLR